MPKIKPFQSPFEYIATKSPLINKLSDLYFKLNKFDDPVLSLGADPRDPTATYFLGGFNPLLAMGKDVVDTFKVYKSNFYILRDLIQPLRGIGNIIKGSFNLIASPILFVSNTFRYALLGIKSKNFRLFLNNMSSNLAKTTGGILEGITSIIRGVTQVITTPLTWLIRMPLRGIITCAKGRPTIVDLQRNKAQKTADLVNKESTTVGDAIAIDRVLPTFHTKVFKGRRRGMELGTALPFFWKHNAGKGCPKFANKQQLADRSAKYSLNETKKAIALDILGIFTTENDSSKLKQEMVKEEKTITSTSTLPERRI